MDRLLRSKDDATRAREIYKDDALRMIAAAPWVGLGMNTYSLHVPDFGTLPLRAYGPAMVSVHQIYYLWWVETGIFGMLLFCAVWGSIILMGLANLTIRNEFLFAINAACLAATISLIPDGFLSFTLKVNVPLRMFWLYAGMIMAVRYLHERTANAEPAGVSDSAVSLNVPEPEPSLR
jgi:O-antigen ligase